MSVAVRQTLRILEILAPHPTGYRLSELANATGIHPPSVLRLLRLLREEGYVIQDPVSDRWRATLRLGALGIRQLAGLGADQLGATQIDALSQATGELCVLAARVGDRLLRLRQAQGSSSGLSVIPQMGIEPPLHASAVGKAFLSTFPDDKVVELVGDGDLSALTPSTITHSAALLEDLAAVRANGYAIVIDELEPGVSAVAAPIRSGDDPTGPAVAALSVAGPSARLDRNALEKMVPQVLETAAAITAEWPALQALVPISTRDDGDGAPSGS
jgi:DNA-binding IclR family transcriptional regulator